MSPLTCERCRATLVGDADADALRMRGEIASHLEGCADCRAFAAALRAGAQAWLDEDAAGFADSVLARTSAVEAILAELRELSEMDPGPGFTERVLRHTSARPMASRWRAGLLAGWRAMVSRPRFAWEVAYVAMLCWVLAFGNPVAAWEWGSQRVGTIAQQRLGRTAADLRADLESWRARLAPETPPDTPTVTEDARAQPSAFDRAWQSASTWIRASLGRVFDAFMSLWDRVAEWTGDAAPDETPARDGEPGARGARSTQ